MQTIMIVDDEISVTQTLKMLLRLKTQKRVLTFNTPLEALASNELKEKKVDVIVSDFIMPEMNGITFLNEVQKIDSSIETILLTGYADKENAIRSINEVGVYYYLEKPWQNEELIKIIKNALEKKHLADTLDSKIEALEEANIKNKKLLEIIEDKYQNEIENTKHVMRTLTNIIEAKDPYTNGHSIRVSKICVEIAKAKGLSEDEINRLEIAGMIHDIGKIGIAESILNKPGKLTDEEFDHIKTHTDIGERILSPLSAFSDHLSIVRHHHEKLNGHGYPDGLQSEELNTLTRILTVADIFDALYSDRPYRKKMPLEKAKSILLEEADRGNIDIDIVKCLIELIENDTISVIREN